MIFLCHEARLEPFEQTPAVGTHNDSAFQLADFLPPGEEDASAAAAKR
jgi:hypothetical protein